MCPIWPHGGQAGQFFSGTTGHVGHSFSSGHVGHVGHFLSGHLGHLHIQGGHVGHVLFGMELFKTYLVMSGRTHSLRSIYLTVSTSGAGQGGILDFSTYLLRSGHRLGHGGGHFGQGGQYTRLGQPHVPTGAWQRSHVVEEDEVVSVLLDDVSVEDTEHVEPVVTVFPHVLFEPVVLLSSELQLLSPLVVFSS